MYVCIYLFIYFWPHRAACGILVPQPGIEPEPPALAMQSLNCWTTREVPRQGFWSNFFFFLRNGREWFSRNKHGFHCLLKFLQILKDIKSLESMFSPAPPCQSPSPSCSNLFQLQSSHPGTSLNYLPGLSSKSSYLLVYSFVLFEHILSNFFIGIRWR